MIHLNSDTDSEVPSNPHPQKSKRTAFLQRTSEGRGASSSLEVPMGEDHQPHIKGKRRVKMTERAK